MGSDLIYDLKIHHWVVQIFFFIVHKGPSARFKKEKKKKKKKNVICDDNKPYHFYKLQFFSTKHISATENWSVLVSNGVIRVFTKDYALC